MLKGKLVIIAILIAVFVSALGFQSAARFQTPAHPVYTVPADPIPVPIAPPPV